jgi:hypothetical protein
VLLIEDVRTLRRRDAQAVPAIAAS